ncbi:FMN-binding negative transcriptional regulator [Flavobacteriaceae bacterium R38]|nr:FMN-binding negative transcriptional regulator [Flavobacteriaceae bacterium R38]
MYIPLEYKNTNVDEIREFINANSFGILVNQTNKKLWATHTPMELTKNAEGKDVLLTHISRGNMQWKGIDENQDVLAIFQGPHTYISSSWYDYESVPTWNYIAVHVYGKMKLLEGQELRDALKRLIDKYEVDSEHPISMEKMSEKYINREIKGVKGLEIEITSIEASYKLSQGKSPKNHESIVSELKKRGDAGSDQIAEAMKKFQKK